jgi:hypothetical protein
MLFGLVLTRLSPLALEGVAGDRGEPGEFPSTFCRAACGDCVSMFRFCAFLSTPPLGGLFSAGDGLLFGVGVGESDPSGVGERRPLPHSLMKDNTAQLSSDTIASARGDEVVGAASRTNELRLPGALGGPTYHESEACCTALDAKLD